jgi:hypothetical protein
MERYCGGNRASPGQYVPGNLAWSNAGNMWQGSWSPYGPYHSAPGQPCCPPDQGVCGENRRSIQENYQGGCASCPDSHSLCTAWNQGFNISPDNHSLTNKMWLDVKPIKENYNGGSAYKLRDHTWNNQIPYQT